MEKARGWEVEGSNTSDITNLIRPKLVILYDYDQLFRSIAA